MMKNTRRILFVCILFMAGCASEPNAEELLLEAEQLENQGEYLEAIRILDKVIALDPDLLGAYINRGADYAELGKHDMAIENYKIVLEKDDRNQLALFNLGMHYARLQQYRQAVNHYNSILNDASGNPMGESVFIRADGSIGEFQVPFHEVAYERGLAYYELHRWDSAFYDFRFCIDANYMVPESRYMCGAVFEIYGMNKEACKEYTLAANMGDQDAEEARKEICK